MMGFMKGALKAALGTAAFGTVISSIYALDFYRAEDHMDYAAGVRIKRNFGYIEYGDPEYASVAFLFYPGGKVGLNAYGELMTRIASKGIFCVACGMPLNLAVLNTDAADKYVKKYSELYPNIKTWYIGGHSLGGTIACKHAIKRTNIYEGVVFLAAFPDKDDDMNGTGLRALSIYGSIDSVMNRAHYNEYGKNFPHDMREVVIEGGNHGNFGTYGFQNGDHTSMIPRTDQINIAAKAIVDFLRY